MTDYKRFSNPFAANPRASKASARAARSEALMNSTYHAARAKAQARANELGLDHGLEWNDVFHEWSIRMLPRRENRYGHELRVEVVHCESDKCQVGHGYGR